MAQGSSSNQLTIGIRADASKLRADLAIAQAQVGALGKELRAAANESLRTGDTAPIRGLADAFENARARVTGLRGEIGAAGAAVETMHGHFATAGARLGNLHGRMNEFGTALSNTAGRILPFNANIVAMGAAVLAAAAPFALLAKAKSAALATDELVDTAQNIGITTDQLAALRLMAKEEGSEVDRLAVALGKFNIATANAAIASKDFRVEMKGLPEVIRGPKDASVGLNNDLITGVDVMRGAAKAIDATGNAFQTLGFSAADAGALMKMDLFERLKVVAGAINRLKSEALQNKLANELFGRSWKDLLPVLANGGKEFEAAMKRVKESRLGPDDAQKGFAAGFLKSFALIEAQFGALTTFMGNVVGSVFIPIFGALSAVMTKNFDEIKARGLALGQAMVPIVNDIVLLIQGVGKEGLKTDFVRGLVSAFDQVKAAATLAFEVIRQGFMLLVDILNPVAALINSLFGTQLTGNTLAAAAAVLYFVGAFNLLAAAIGVVVAAIAAFGSIPVAIGLALALVIANVYASRDVIAGTFQGLWDVIAAGFGLVMRSIGDGVDWIGQKFSAGVALWFRLWQDFVFTPIISGFQTAIFWAQYLIGLAKQGLQAVSDLFSGASGVVASAPIPRSGGGPVPGRGTGDTVRALLTPGEFVQRVAAVRYYGVDFMRRINSLQLPRFELGGIVDSLRDGLSVSPQRFAMGGMVEAIGATGGGRGHQSEFTIVLSGQSFPVSADREIANSLIRTSRRAHMLSAIKKPGSHG